MARELEGTLGGIGDSGASGWGIGLSSSNCGSIDVATLSYVTVCTLRETTFIDAVLVPQDTFAGGEVDASRYEPGSPSTVGSPALAVGGVIHVAFSRLFASEMLGVVIVAAF